MPRTPELRSYPTTVGPRKQRSQSPGTYSILRGWLQADKLARTQCLLRKACKERKRERINSLLLEAESSKHPSAIFSVVRRLALKSRTLRIQLRDKEGRLLAGAEESDQIASFLHTVFHSKHLVEAPKVDPFPAVQFETSELLQALHNLGSRKAPPSTFAPASLWKLAPLQVVQRYNCISYRRSPLLKNPRTSDLSPYCTRGINFLQQCWPPAFKARLQRTWRRSHNGPTSNPDPQETPS